MWIDEYTSSFTRRSDSTIASSKLCPYHGMNATVTLAPSASSPCSVPAPSATICPAFTFWPTCTSGRWLMAVSWLVRQERDQRRGDGHELLRRHVHEVDATRCQQRVVVPLAAQHQLVGEMAVFGDARVRLGHRVLLLLRGREPADLVAHLAALHHAV